MYGFKRFLVSALSITGLMSIAAPSDAVTLNGFNGSFGTATTIGDATIQGAFAGGPTEGSGQALITTGASAVSAQGALEAFIGINSGNLDNGSGFGAQDGSAINQTFSAAAGATISFNWNFLTNETAGGNNDYAFVIIDRVSSSLPTILADVTNAITPTSPFSFQTTFNTFTSAPLTAGTHTISFGVVDIDDTTGNSGLLVDNFTVTAVPFEFSPAAGLLALGVLFGVDRLRRKIANRKIQK